MYTEETQAEIQWIHKLLDDQITYRQKNSLGQLFAAPDSLPLRFLAKTDISLTRYFL